MDSASMEALISLLESRISDVWHINELANKEGIDTKIINRITRYLAVFLVFVVTLACGLLAPDASTPQNTPLPPAG
jgi:preprotein translocase subunit SecY